MANRTVRIVMATFVALFLIVVGIIATKGAYARDSGTAASFEPRSMHGCSTADIAGDWAFRVSGKANGMDVLAVGTLHNEKDGTSTTHGWRNIGGTMSAEFSRTGTTTVNADCTGTTVWNDSPVGAKIVVLRQGREIWASYDAPQFSLVILKRIDEPL